MHMKVKILMAAVVTLAALAAATGVASAAEFSFSPGGSDDAVSEGKISFANSFATLECNLTLTLNWLRGPIAKVAGNKLGEVTSINWANCSGGNWRAALATPWEIQYESISGTLPEAVSTLNVIIKNIGMQFSLFFGLSNCLWGGDLTKILTLNHRTGVSYTTGGQRLDETKTLGLRSGPEACPSTIAFQGRFFLASVQTLTRS